MIRNLALLATAAAIVAVPQIAQAGCSGSACSALSTTTNYSASDKRVRATVTNKDSNPIHLKFCVNVDYHCNGFEATLSPRETITRDVSFNGPKPPQIHAVDVVTAEFPAQRPAAATGATAAPSAAVLDTPRGKLSYIAAKQGVVVPSLTKAISHFTNLDYAFSEAKQHADRLDELSEKLGSIKDVESQISEFKNKDREVKNEAHIAKGADLQLNHFATTLRHVQTSAAFAATNLTITSDDLKEANNLQRARDLRAEAEKARSGLDGLLKVIVLGVDASVAFSSKSDPAGKIGAAVDAAQKIIDTVMGNPWTEEAEKLEAEAFKIGAENAEKKFKVAGAYLKTLKQEVTGMQGELPQYKALQRNSWDTAEGNYDKVAQAQKRYGSFNFDNLQRAVDEAQKTIDLSRKTTESAYGTREALRQLSQSAGDWMAFPSEGRRVIDVMDSESKTAFDWGVKERQHAELLLKKFQDMYAVAREAMQ